MKEHDTFEDIVSEALEKGSTFELPQDFADRVVLRVQREIILKEAKHDRWWLIAGIVSFVAALVFAFLKVDFKPSVGVFTFFKGYWGLTVFGVLFVIALHIIDKRIISHSKNRVG